MLPPPAPDFSASQLAASTHAWLVACPSGVVIFAAPEPETAPLKVLTANRAALALLQIDERARGVEDLLLGALHDEREPALRERVGHCAADGTAQALKLLARPPGVTGGLLLEARFARTAEGIAVFFEPAQARGGKLRDPMDAIAMQRAVYDISRATHEALTLDALFERIHGIVERLIGAKNLYIALIDEAEQMVRFPYSKDEFDGARKPRRLGLGLTEVVYLTGQSLLIDRAKANQMLQAGTVVNHGMPAQVWLGVPLVVTGKTVGVMAVQDYHNPHFLGEAERQLLGYISDQIANAIALKRAEAAALAARDEAERAGRTKADFIGVMSHELRTPLTIIIGFSDLLRETLSNPVERGQAANINQAAHRLLAAIDQVLDFSKADALTAAVREEDVDLGQMLVVCEAFFAARMREKRLTFDVKREGFVPDGLRTDTQLLKQILMNLLSNAVKFTPEGGRITLGVRAELAAPFREGKHQFEFTVEDNGPGVSAEMRNRLFQPFERAALPGRGEGAGLGLAIGQRFAQLLGGRVTLEDASPQGSIFTLRLTAPAAGASTDGNTPDITERLELRLRSRLRESAWQVLIVDSDAQSRAVTSALVEGTSGAAPLTAGTFDEALVHWRDARPHMIFIDVPAVDLGLGGFIARIQTADQPASTSHPRPLLVALSVNHSTAHVQRCLAAGADDFLPKPLSRRALVEILLRATVQQRQ